MGLEDPEIRATVIAFDELHVGSGGEAALGETTAKSRLELQQNLRGYERRCQPQHAFHERDGQ